MRARTMIDFHNIRANIEHTRRTSDRIFGFGPFGIGLDGFLTAVPVVGQLYTVGAAAYLLTQGVRARVPGIVLWQMSALFLADFVVGSVPVVGILPDILFRGHHWAGGLLMRAIDRTTYVGGNDDEPSEELSDAMRSGRHVVQLGRA